MAEYKGESVSLADELSLEFVVEVIDGEEAEAECQVDGMFVVDAEKRHEFAQKLEALITEYRV